MHVLLTLLIVATQPAAPIEVDHAAADPLFACSFDESWDKDYEGWPDGWTRRRGPGFPRYVKVQISREPTPADDSCLRVDLDGGGAVAYSPAIPVSNGFGYVAECQLSTEGLAHDRAFLSITLLDEKRRRVETYTSEKTHYTDGWKLVRLGPVATDDPEACLAVLGLHIEPLDGSDLTGTARFDDVRLRRVPRMALSLESPGQPVARHFFASSDGISVRLDASGFRDAASSVAFRLIDVEGRTLADSRTLLTTDVTPDLLTGSARWLPPVPGPGFYRLCAEMTAADQSPLGSVETAFAVIEPHDRARLSEFGWTLPGGGRPFTFDELVPLMEQSGVGRVKYPLWLDAEADPEDVEERIRFGRQLSARGIELIGLLADPPFDVPGQIDPKQPPTAAEVFTAPAEVWQPSLEAVIGRLSSEVRRWQLGVDGDTSFVGYPGLSQKIAQVRSQLDAAGASLELGFGWDWAEGLPPASAPADAPWEFVSLCGNPPSDTLAETQSCPAERWVTLDTLDRSHPAGMRAADLVRRIVEAKLGGVEGIFMPRVFDPERGLFDADGVPSDLVPCWRTSAVLLGGTEPMGSIAMPGGSSNRFFREGDRVVMVAWNDRPCEERLYLGRDVRQFDPWGRPLPVSAEADRQRFTLGPLPTFLVGIDGRAVQWRQGFRLATSRLPSLFGQRHSTEMQITNPLDRPARGTLALHAPKGWRVEPSQVRFVLAVGETMNEPLGITLPFDATAGRHEIRAEFRVEEEDSRGGSGQEGELEEDSSGKNPPQPPSTLCFSAYRSMEVGLEDVAVEVTTRLADSGALEVRQRLINRGQEPVSFRFTLFAPERRAMRSEILDQPPGSVLKTYRLPDGANLVGKPLWLRGEDPDRGHTLNYRIVAQP
jgi:hypothetical protein